MPALPSQSLTTVTLTVRVFILSTLSSPRVTFTTIIAISHRRHRRDHLHPSNPPIIIVSHLHLHHCDSLIIVVFIVVTSTITTLSPPSPQSPLAKGGAESRVAAPVPGGPEAVGKQHFLGDKLFTANHVPASVTATHVA